MTEERIDFLNRKYAIASLFVDLEFSPRYDILGKVFGPDMKLAADEIGRFRSFDGHAVVRGVPIGYEHLVVRYVRKKTSPAGYKVKIHPGGTGFSAVPATT